MKRSYELQLDNQALLCGTVRMIDVGEYEVDDLSVLVWIRGIDYDITDVLSAKQIEGFEEELMNEALKHPEDFVDEGEDL